MSDPIPLDKAKRRGRRPSDEDIPRSGPDKLARLFDVDEQGVFVLRRSESGEQSWTFVCAPLRVVAETNSPDGISGVLLEWTDRRGRTMRQVFPRSMIAGDCRDVRAYLADRGLTLDTSLAARSAFQRYLNLSGSDSRLLAVDRPGWHCIEGDFAGSPDMESRWAFVLPRDVFGSRGDSVVMQNVDPDTPFRASGDLGGWQRKIAALAPGNVRLTFSISVAFTGPLLNLIDSGTTGFHWRGQSRSGKTTLLVAASSVWGGGLKHGAADFVQNWRSTSSGLEAIAAKFNDTLLAIDELAQADAAMVSDAIYMLGNGIGKVRADRTGLPAKPPARWRLAYLSTGETSVAVKAAEAKRHVNAGVESRLVELAADAGVGLGVFGQLHDFESADDLAMAIGSASRSCYGTAGPAFLRWLVEQTDTRSEFVPSLRRQIDDLAEKWLGRHPGAGGQVREAARRFALVGAAGELAIKAAVTPWHRGEAAEAAEILFGEWLSARGTLGSSEDQKAIELLDAFIGAEGSSRFEDWESSPVEPMSADGPFEEREPNRRVRIPNRAGWRRYVRDSSGLGAYWYYVLPQAMREALQPLNFDAALVALEAAGRIKGDGRARSQKLRPPGDAPQRLYCVPRLPTDRSEGEFRG